ncbi:hypothetical protein DPEC_G00101650 [Dallia pectoralis]|uniref:Uncharacterized protein n=1 Tax=Dallia pectoralis TaxID=75939 RepID=A0ACC2GXT0_DALPE|nr:hypothetical protein DPEC_G00101650 [Dallia pectoralis]
MQDTPCPCPLHGGQRTLLPHLRKSATRTTSVHGNQHMVQKGVDALKMAGTTNGETVKENRRFPMCPSDLAPFICLACWSPFYQPISLNGTDPGFTASLQSSTRNGSSEE